MKILLACSAGMSTSLLEESMRKYMTSAGIEGEVIAVDSTMAKLMMKDYDILLIGPQVKFMLREFQTLAAGRIPVDSISPADYAMAKGENVVKTAMKMLGK